jgi:aminoglycoside phosphotransferase (APT) family kinase protein
MVIEKRRKKAHTSTVERERRGVMGQPWSAEYVVSQQLARQLINEQFPKLEVVHLQELGKGFDNTVFVVNDCYVFRFPRRAIAVDLLKTEIRILPQLVSYLPIQIPEPIFIGKPSDLYPWPFAGYRFVSGKAPTTLTNRTRLKSIKPLARFLRALHHFPIQKAKEFSLAYDPLHRLNIAKRKQQLEAHMEQIKSMGLWNDYASLDIYVSSLRHINYENRKVLVHGDLHFRNLLVDDEGILSGVIDWGDVHIGHPAVDLAIVYSFLPPEGRALFYEVYGHVDDETKKLAQFRAIYTSVVLLLYSHDLGDIQMIKAAKESLKFALAG